MSIIYRVMVRCAAGHRRTVVDALTQMQGRLTSGNETLVDERPVEPKLIFGTSRHGGDPSMVDAYETSGRSRHVLVCRRCGLRVEMTPETARRLVQGLIDDPNWLWTERAVESSTFRVSSLDLQALAATLS